MSSEFKNILISRYKEGMISYLNEHPEAFDEAVKLALGDENPYCWRSAFVIHDVMEPDDPRLKSRLSDIADALPHKKDGHQRELLKILLKAELDEEIEGPLFDYSISLWESVRKQPSVRFIAIKYLIQMAEKYPELIHEVTELAQPQYVNSLSPGIKNATRKMIAELEKKSPNR